MHRYSNKHEVERIHPKMTSKIRLVHRAFDLVSPRNLRKNPFVEDYLLRLEGLPRKFRETFEQIRIGLIDRTTLRNCEDCYRPIRPWHDRVSITESVCIHGICQEKRQFFRDYIRHQIRQQGAILEARPELSEAASLIVAIVSDFDEALQQNGKDSLQCEYIRGMLNGAKSMLAKLCGAEIREQVIDEIRRRTGKPLPNTIPLAADGNRYGWDVDAEAGQ